jgi:hypothetical protein
VNQAEDVIQDLGVVRVLLEPHQLIVDGIEALVGFGQEFPQKIVHQNTPSKTLVLRPTVNRSSHQTQTGLATGYSFSNGAGRLQQLAGTDCSRPLSSGKRLGGRCNFGKNHVGGVA